MENTESLPDSQQHNYRMPYMIFDHPVYQTLSATARAAYMYLLFRSDGGGDAWPTEETIGIDLGRSTKQAGRDVRELVSAGLVVTTKKWKHNQYLILLPEEASDTPQGTHRPMIEDVSRDTLSHDDTPQGTHCPVNNSSRDTPSHDDTPQGTHCPIELEPRTENKEKNKEENKGRSRSAPEPAQDTTTNTTEVLTNMTDKERRLTDVSEINPEAQRIRKRLCTDRAKKKLDDRFGSKAEYVLAYWVWVLYQELVVIEGRDQKKDKLRKWNGETICKLVGGLQDQYKTQTVLDGIQEHLERASDPVDGCTLDNHETYLRNMLKAQSRKGKSNGRSNTGDRGHSDGKVLPIAREAYAEEDRLISDL